MIGVDTIVDIEELILPSRHPTRIAKAIDQRNTDNSERTWSSSYCQVSHHDQRSSWEQESRYSDRFHSDFLTEIARCLLQKDSWNADNREEYIAVSIFHLVKKIQKKARSERIPESKYQYQYNRPENIHMRWSVHEYLPDDFALFFCRDFHFLPRDFLWEWFLFWLDHEIFCSFDHLMEIHLLYGFYEIFFHMFLVPTLDGDAEVVDIFDGYTILWIIEKSDGKKQKSRDDDT